MTQVGQHHVVVLVSMAGEKVEIAEKSTGVERHVRLRAGADAFDYDAMVLQCPDGLAGYIIDKYADISVECGVAQRCDEAFHQAEALPHPDAHDQVLFAAHAGALVDGASK